MKRLIVAAMFAVAVPAHAQLVLKVHSFSGPQAPDQAKHLFPWSEKINKLAGGKMKIEVYTNMQLGGKPADLPQQLEDGVVDIILHVPGFSPGRFPALEGTELPFTNVGTSTGQSPALYEWATRWLMNGELKGMRMITSHATDPSVLHVRRQVKTLEDFKGMKLRVPGRFIGEAAKAWGATPVGLPISGVYEALERNQVDGMLTNWAIVPPFRLHEVTSFHLETPIYQSPIMTLMSQRSYDKLPADMKKLIDDNSGFEYTKHLGKEWDELTVPAKDAIRKRGNTIYSLSEPERQRWIKAAQPVYKIWIEEMNKRRLPGQKMFDDLLATTQKYGRK